MSCSLVIIFRVIMVLILLGCYNERYLDSYRSPVWLEIHIPGPKSPLPADLGQCHTNTSELWTWKVPVTQFAPL